MRPPLTDWQVFFVDDGETQAAARYIRHHRRIFDAEDAAQAACEWDYHHRDGWERGMENPFRVGVISPEGEVSYFRAWSAQSVSHHVEEDEETTEEMAPPASPAVEDDGDDDWHDLWERYEFGSR